MYKPDTHTNDSVKLSTVEDDIIANAKKAKQAEADKWQWFYDAVKEFAEEYGYGFDLGLKVIRLTPLHPLPKGERQVNEGVEQVLWVKCEDSVVRFEMTKMKADFLEILNKYSKDKIKDVLFR